MISRFNFDAIRPAQAALADRPVYSAVHDLPDLHVFVAHRVYSVWDFTSLIKATESVQAGTTSTAPSANCTRTPCGMGCSGWLMGQGT